MAAHPSGEMPALEELHARLERECRRLGAALAAGACGEGDLPLPDPEDIARVFRLANARLAAMPERLIRVQQGWLEDLSAAARRAASEDPDGFDPGRIDRRFRDSAWREPPFLLLAEAYARTVHRIQELYRDLPDLEPQDRRKLGFYLRLYLNAIAPSNFPATNPVVLRRAQQTRGRSLLAGLAQLVEDLARGGGRLHIRTNDERAFALGRDLAATPGKVVLRNRLIELIHYAPTTPRAHRTPLLIVPPWINKFYVLDLRAHNSFVRFALAQELSVFLISWVNPDAELRQVGFEDYLREGLLAALDAVRVQTGEGRAHVLGYCIGGTLVACLLAWLAAREEERVRTATLLTALTDFSDPGDLGVFIDDAQLERLEQHMNRHGYLHAAYMQTVFSLLRDVDLIWSFAIDRYLLGLPPRAYDLLYWNADGTHMPAMMHSFYLRRLYLENRLVRPGGLELLGERLDLRRIRVPCYVLATREDHIAPWRSVYAGARLFGGPLRFVLAGSGHVAGVIHPPQGARYGYWRARGRPADPEAWLRRAERCEGSWWADWAGWIRRRSGPRLAARHPERGVLPPLEDAPGSYVRVRRLP